VISTRRRRENTAHLPLESPMHRFEVVCETKGLIEIYQVNQVSWIVMSEKGSWLSKSVIESAYIRFSR
jgi:hypothetical protein